ncbi:hypothetical protein SD37_31750 [Amycolatopsis orientalis]|uniref:Uncharacterized protein n=1 Tax=Amycolatopsis orientalis TaxID=31958 RepID=A0A193C593_AMYOR|nr:hypothetical protein [Amycolatopsis orientalis]ANN19746.1 hypothetical protein SD37_31750 [Amycolatopsis orientalis]
MSIALGTLPDWIAGVSTTGALIAAGFAAKAAFGQVQHLKKQVRQATQLEEDRRKAQHRAQASQVAIWIETDGDVPRIMFGNQSGLPIYAVTVVCQIHWLQKAITVPYSALGPTGVARELVRVRKSLEATAADELYTPIRVVKGMGRVKLSKQLREGSKLGQLGSSSWADLVADKVSVGLSFRDAAEVPWARHPNGHLTEHGMGGAATAHLMGEWELL